MQQFHAIHPGSTARQMEDARREGGGSSYAWLADGMASVLDGALLDVACGDGPLLDLWVARGASPSRVVGVDASAAELALAAARPHMAGVRLLQARAQALPFADASFDGIGCHMALMVMDDVEVVVAELARVLRPGGTIAVVVGGGVPPTGAFAVFAELFGRRWQAGEVANPVRLGDARTFSAEGLRALFSAAFADVTIDGDRLELGGTADAVWRNLVETYDVAMLDHDQREALRAEYDAAIAAAGYDRGAVPMSIGVLRMVARRSGA